MRLKKKQIIFWRLKKSVEMQIAFPLKTRTHAHTLNIWIFFKNFL